MGYYQGNEDDGAISWSEELERRYQQDQAWKQSLIDYRSRWEQETTATIKKTLKTLEDEYLKFGLGTSELFSDQEIADGYSAHMDILRSILKAREQAQATR